MSGRVVHFEIPYDDGDRARRFYKEAFGWQLQEIPEMEYTLVTTGPGGEQGPSEPGFINGGMLHREEGGSTGPTAYGSENRVISVRDSFGRPARPAIVPKSSLRRMALATGWLTVADTWRVRWIRPLPRRASYAG